MNDINVFKSSIHRRDFIKGLVGWEWNGAADVRNRPNSTHAATIYNGPRDNVVFNAGTIWWAQGMPSPPGHVLPATNRAKPKPDPRVQRMTKNVFDRFIK